MIKQLKSRFAFVLTGTPIENRIDDIYSIVQFLDPHLFGPLFRFNREFYELDEKGKPEGYKNLDKLHAKLQPILLRRTKSDVESQLPKRTDHHYYLPMHEEQQVRYDEHHERVAKIAHQAKKRPLRPEEFKRLQMGLACMRMLCDTPYILDEDCRVSPKLEELEKILTDLLNNKSNKIIIFSEWERMLRLVRSLAQSLTVGTALAYGYRTTTKTPPRNQTLQRRSRLSLIFINRFRQRWLKLTDRQYCHQLRFALEPCQVRTAHCSRLGGKIKPAPVKCHQPCYRKQYRNTTWSDCLRKRKNLFSGAIDGDENFKSLAMPSGRKAFLDRLDQMLGDEQEEVVHHTTRPKPEKFEDDCVASFAERLDLFCQD